jgi:putative FmdB family regulatory protein
MPTYEYHCAACGRNFTRIESVATHEKRGKVECPQCGSTRVQRALSTFYAKTGRKS